MEPTNGGIKGICSAQRTVKRLTVHISPADCVACTLAIEEKIKKMQGVRKIIPILMMNQVLIDFDPTKITSEDIAKAIGKTGYDVTITGGG